MGTIRALFAYCLTLLIMSNVYAFKRKEIRFPNNDLAAIESEFTLNIKNNLKTAKELARVKEAIINGDLIKAKVILLQTQYGDRFSRTISLRYLSLIYFIEGNYEKSLEFLNKKELRPTSNSKYVCMLKTMNYMVMNRITAAKLEWRKCEKITVNDAKSKHLWMKTLVALKTERTSESVKKPFKGVSIENETGELLRLYIKLALYLNQTDFITKRLPYFNIDSLRDQEIRELIGILYFRSGKLTKAYEFLEDLNTPNAENIKGNILLAQTKYEQAFAQFKLALNKKRNSNNALERIIPLTWILKQWKDGLSYVKRLNVGKQFACTTFQST